MIDTGFDYHCDIYVDKEGDRSDKEALAAMRNNINGIKNRDNVNTSKLKEKWFFDKEASKWIYVLGVTKNAHT